MSFMAGTFISLGAHGAIVTYDTPFLSAAVFPVGLMLVILVGGELFTGNCLMTFALLQKKITFKNYCRSLIQVFFGNFLGALFIAALLYFGGVYERPALAEAVRTIARTKSSLPFWQVLCRGILCNILVASGVWFATTAKNAAGKMLGCWFPVMLFVLSGYEHVVANMFYLPLGTALGASVTASGFLGNLFWAAIGNYIGGGLLLPFVYHRAYLSKHEVK